MATPRIQVVTATNRPKQRRKPRRPQHAFNLKAKPYELTPFMIAPVLPGESMTSLLMQARAVSDPVKNPLIGWWKEYYLYYIPLPALADPVLATNGTFDLDDITGFALDPAIDLSTINAVGANDATLYQFKSAVNFVGPCLSYVMNMDFRDEDDLGNFNYIENFPGVYVDQSSWLHSLKLESATGDDTELPGVDDQEELDILPGFTTHYAQWEIMRDNGMTDLSYADFLKSYGVSTNAADEVGGGTDGSDKFPFKGELIRYVRKWTYPTNHIDPTTGAPSSALSWSIAENADKTRFFKYPGFIFGVTCTRPKIYFGNQKGAAVGLLKNAYTWLPAVLQGHPYTSVVEQLDSATDGILQGGSEDYWLDVKDLFLHGDQFVNFAMNAANNHGVALPTTGTESRIITEAMVDSLFVTAGSEYVREDGVVHLNVLSNIGADTTPG